MQPSDEISAYHTANMWSLILIIYFPPSSLLCGYKEVTTSDIQHCRGGHINFWYYNRTRSRFQEVNSAI